jgi:ABC-type xylose transport system substrate-binding protein
MSDNTIQSAVAALEKSYLEKEAEITAAKDEEEVASIRRVRLERESHSILKNLINKRTELYLAVIKQQEETIAGLKSK